MTSTSSCHFYCLSNFQQTISKLKEITNLKMFEGNRPKRTCLIVLGDIGRSPRMQYHAKSFAENNFLVDFVGYLENPPIQEVLDNTRINIHKMHEFPEFYLPRILKYLFKVLWQILSIMNVFLRLKTPDYVGKFSTRINYSNSNFLFCNLFSINSVSKSSGSSNPSHVLFLL